MRVEFLHVKPAIILVLLVQVLAVAPLVIQHIFVQCQMEIAFVVRDITILLFRLFVYHVIVPVSPAVELVLMLVLLAVLRSLGLLRQTIPVPVWLGITIILWQVAVFLVIIPALPVKMEVPVSRAVLLIIEC
jgi:hypothetical protein